MHTTKTGPLYTNIVILIVSDGTSVDSATFPKGTPPAGVRFEAESLINAYPDCRIIVRQGMKLLLSAECADLFGVLPEFNGDLI